MRRLYLAAVNRLDEEILKRHQKARALRDRIRRHAENDVKLATDFEANGANDRSTHEELAAATGRTPNVVGGFSKTPEAAALLEPESWSVIDLLWELQAELEAIRSLNAARANMIDVARALGARAGTDY